jgi:putative transposase
LKRKKRSRQDIWHLDEVVITISGEKRYLWRAVDQDGYVLDEIVQIRRDTRAAKRLLERLLRKQGCPPKRMITDKLGSYGAARRKILPKVEHRQHKGLSNRAENSHVPIRKRERAMQGFRSWSGLQKFVETFSTVRNHFVPPHSHRSASASPRGNGGMEIRHADHRLKLIVARHLRRIRVNLTSPFNVEIS